MVNSRMLFIAIAAMLLFSAHADAALQATTDDGLMGAKHHQRVRRLLFSQLHSYLNSGSLQLGRAEISMSSVSSQTNLSKALTSADALTVGRKLSREHQLVLLGQIQTAINSTQAELRSVASLVAETNENFDHALEVANNLLGLMGHA